MVKTGKKNFTADKGMEFQEVKRMLQCLSGHANMIQTFTEYLLYAKN